MGDFDAIHAKLAYQTIAYFCHRIDWRGQNSAETSTTWGKLATFLSGHREASRWEGFPKSNLQF